jgi:predicted XRE-type DNA-binding protein
MIEGAKAMPKKTPDDAIHLSSGNVFEDLGLPRARELFAKAEIVRHMLAIISRRRLTQSQASKLLGIDQPKVSALLNGNFSGFSTDRLLRLLTRLGADIEIGISPKTSSRATGQIRVTRKIAVKPR